MSKGPAIFVVHFESMEQLRNAMEALTTYQEKVPVKNGKPPGRKPKVVKASYKLDYSKRGRVPNWVLKQAKVGSKDALRRKFKDGHRFVP